MDKSKINSQLESEFSNLIDRYHLSDIVELLDRYLEGKTKLAWELETKNATYWSNASGFCRMMAGELEKITTVYKG